MKTLLILLGEIVPGLSEGLVPLAWFFPACAKKGVVALVSGLIPCLNPWEGDELFD